MANDDRLNFIERSVSELKTKFTSVSLENKDLRNKIKNTPTINECALKHQALSEVLVDIKDAVKKLNVSVGELDKVVVTVKDKVSKELRPIRDQLDKTQPIIIETVHEELTKQSDKSKSNIIFWLTSISLVLGIISSIGYGIYKVTDIIQQSEASSRFRDEINKNTSKELLDSIRELKLKNSETSLDQKVIDRNTNRKRTYRRDH